jgi:tol-pal system protein YbgF
MFYSPLTAAGRGIALVISAALPGVSLAQAPVQDNAALDQRVARLEQVVNSQTLIELLNNVQSLQREVQSLRGEIELQGHGVSQLKQRQRELYLDIDRRLQRLEMGQGTTATIPPPAVAATAPATPTPPAYTTQPRPPVAAVPAPAQPVPAVPAPSVPAPSVPATAAAAPSTASPPGQALVNPAEEQRAYQASFDLLKAGRYEPATKAFAEFLQQYPNGQFADNAKYWLAEAYYVTRQFEPALRQFELLVAEHPDSQKLTHALLKIGYIRAELGQREEAERVLNDLIQRFPESTAAGLARKRLQRIRSG